MFIPLLLFLVLQSAFFLTTSVVLNIDGASLSKQNYVGDHTRRLIQLFIQPEELVLLPYMGMD